MPHVTHLPADTDIETLMTVLRRDGALIVDGLVSDAEMAALEAEVMPYIASDADRPRRLSPATARPAPARWWRDRRPPAR